ncbi:MAG TPA: glycosyltransferase [Streptosporangiaceae bacterium]|nr:glycosyltransferase [Streptosporangiaceae bacterium]
MHVLPSLGAGGMEQLVIGLTADATARGDTVVVAAAPGPWAERARHAGATHAALPETSRANVAGMTAAAACLARWVRRFRPQVVHAHNPRMTLLARLALTATRHNAVLIPTVHGLAPGDYRTASRILRGCAQRVVACAPSVARSLVSAGFPPERVDVILNGAALQPAGPHREAALRGSLGLGPAPVVAGLGRLVAQKDWPTLIGAAGYLPGPSYVVAGEGGLREHLADLAAAAGGQVRFVGLVDDVAALVGLASCVVFTSTWEGLPLTLLEALSLGAPVVATAVDGVTDVVPETAALLVPPGNPRAVATAVERVLNDSALAASLRRDALAAAATWAPAQMLAQYRHAYEAALSAHPR